MNAYVYQLVTVVLQTAQAHNVTVPGGEKYNVPSVNITDPAGPVDPSTVPPTNLTSYTTTAISGADDFEDDKITIKDVFDIIVQTTRKVTPTCMFLIVGSCMFGRLTPFRPKSEPFGVLGTCTGNNFLRNYSDDSFLR